MAQRFALLLVLALALAACAQLPLPPTPTATPGPVATATSAPTAAPTVAPGVSSAGEGVALITGTFSVTNDFIFVYFPESPVALVDLTGFVQRDAQWPIPVEGQTLGYLAIDREALTGNFRLQLPARPEGVLSDVDNDDAQEPGVQVFAVAWWPNLAGDPFAAGDDRSEGWPSYLASTLNDAENNDEVIGGKLVVWSPDANQAFPTGFGPDGKLFTADDPAAPLPAGYSVIDLDQEPFAVSRNVTEELTLYEPRDAAIKDLSALSFSVAFDELVARLRKEYAFNGIAGKEPDWDALVAELRPRMLQAETERDETAFYLALQDFVLAFPDGHVGLNGGQIGAALFQEATAGGYGFAIRELSDGSFLVVYVLADGPAAQAGMQVGATLSAFNGQPIGAAVAAVQPPLNFSTEHSRRYQQARYLLRTRLDERAEVTFTNPGGQPQTATLTAIEERQSFAFTSLFRGSDPNALPVEFRILDSGVGYIKVNANYDDLFLLVRLFERALQTFEANELPGIIIDLRQNTGGAPLGLASYLTDQTIVMGQDEAYSELTGRFEPDGPPDDIEPSESQYRFDTIAVLVGPGCSSACEFEAYAFSQVPGVEVVGFYPTNGIFAEVSRGQYELPAGFGAQFSARRTVLPDGSLLIEGKGVVPTVRVPITAEGLLSGEDVELQVAETLILEQE